MLENIFLLDIMKIIMMHEKVFGSKIQEINNKNYIYRCRQKISPNRKKHIKTVNF